MSTSAHLNNKVNVNNRIQTPGRTSAKIVSIPSARMQKLQGIIQPSVFRPKTQQTPRNVQSNSKATRSAKFRTDILIEEQEKLIKDLQDNLKTRLDSSQLESDDSVVDLKRKIDVTILKYEVVQKLNVELVYARSVLDDAIRHQGDISAARKRVAWLEDRIEKIIMSENEISFPMQTRLKSDSSLRVQRKEKSSNDLNKTEKSANEESRKDSNKSVESESSADLSQRSDMRNETSESNIHGRRKSQLSPSREEPQEETHKGLESAADSQEYYAVLMKDDVNDYYRRPKSVVIHDVDDESVDIQKENEKLEKNKVDDVEKERDKYLNIPHRRFEYSPYVKTLYELDTTTFHQLGLSVRDSYIVRDDEVDSKNLPWIENKEYLESEDLESMKVASRIEHLYKKICKATINSTQPPKEKSFTPVIIPVAREPLSRRAKRLIKSFRRPGQDENSLPHKDDERLGSTMSHSFIFYPHPITPLETAQITRMNTNISFPRSPKVYAKLETPTPQVKHLSPPRRLVNQRNLKEESKLRLYKSNTENLNSITSDPTIFVYDSNKKNQIYEKNNSNSLLTQLVDAYDWKSIKPKSSAAEHDGLKFERIKSLLSVNIKAQSIEERLDAAKHFGLLKAGDAAVLFTLQSILENPNEPEVLRLECSKSLVLLGCWKETVFRYLIKYLKYGNVEVQTDLLKTIINGRNVEYIDKKIEGFDHFNRILEELTHHRDQAVSLDASICLGKLGITDSIGAQTKLKYIVANNSDWNKKTIAIEVLVRQFNLKSKEILDYVLQQMKNSPVWPSRASAARLLAYMGPSIACTRENIENVYDLLEKRLSEDPIKEVRVVIGETMKSLQLYNRAVVRMTKNLESQDEDVRARAVVALETLNVKRGKVIQILVDMLELDGSDHVRTLIIKTLLNLAPNDARVKLAFDKLEQTSHLYVVVKNLKNSMKK